VALEKASFSVGELLESFVSVVAAITRLSDSTESRVVAENVQDAVVSHESARGSLINASLGVCVVFVSEVVKGERLGLVINELDNLIEMLEGDDRHNGSENFVGHELRVQLRVEDDSRLNVLQLLVVILLVSAVYDFASGSLDTFDHSVPVKVVDHFGLVLRSFSREDLFAKGFASVDERLLERLVDEDKVRSNAGLSRILELTSADFVDSVRHITALINDGRAFAS